MEKMVRARDELPASRLFGPADAKIGFIGFGSTSGPILEAQAVLAARGIPTRYLQARTLYPVPTHEIGPFLDRVDGAYVVEHNYTGQFARLLRETLPGAPREAPFHPQLRRLHVPRGPRSSPGMESLRMTGTVSAKPVPPIWCPGCGDFGVLAAVKKAASNLKIAPARTCPRRGNRLLRLDPQLPRSERDPRAARAASRPGGRRQAREPRAHRRSRPAGTATATRSGWGISSTRSRRTPRSSTS